MTSAPEAREECRQRILVIDDEPDIRDTLDSLLSSVGYEVSTAESGADAIERARQEVFDLVITDLRMPGLSGADTVIGLRQIHPSLVVIVVSGYVSDDSALRCREAGAVRIIGKPFHVDELLRIVELALREASG